MKTMSAIYQKVRHRLNDDWAYGNGTASLVLSLAAPQISNLAQRVLLIGHEWSRALTPAWEDSLLAGAVPPY